ncbi:M12 family metallopeptidase [Sorangium sp. So ce119]|uniref:M12 family metallopeptidase n=1 Tax=Sorangium sp. So ce119 TaxID=3133279 RepID=UPI003F605957
MLRHRTFAALPLAFLAGIGACDAPVDDADATAPEPVDAVASPAVAIACETGLESEPPLTSCAPPANQQCQYVSCGGYPWPNARIPFRFEGNYSSLDKARIRRVTELWEQATSGALDFVECPANNCAGEARWLTINLQRNNGGTPTDAGNWDMGIDANQSPQTIAHELGHVIGLPHNFERHDRDRYVRLSKSYFCEEPETAGAPPRGLPFKCRAWPAASAGDQPSITGLFGPFDSTSVMGYPNSTDICELDHQEANHDGWVPAGSANEAPNNGPTAADGSAVLELYRSYAGWVPFHNLGKDMGADHPLEHVLAGSGASAVYMAGDPAVTSWGAPDLSFFVRGEDDKTNHVGRIYQKYKTYNGGAFQSWSDWVQHPLTGLPAGVMFNSDPAVTSWASGRTDLVARASNNNIYIRTYSGTWSNWSSIGAPAGGAASAPAIASWLNHLEVFVRGSDNRFYVRTFDQGVGWSASWSAINTGTFVGKPAAVSAAAGMVHVAGHGIDDRPWISVKSGGAWGGPQPLDGTLLYPGSAPAIASWGPDRFDVFVRGLDGRLWHNQWTSTTSWSGAVPLGGMLGSSPAAVATRNVQRLELAALTEDFFHNDPPGNQRHLGLWYKYWPDFTLTDHYYGINDPVHQVCQ